MNLKSRVEGPRWRDFRDEILNEHIDNFMIFIIGDHSPNHAPQSRSDEEIVQLSDRLKTHVISDTGVNLHPRAKNLAKTVQRILLDKVGAQDTVIIWLDVINITITKHPHGTRTPLSPVELLTEIRALQKIIGIGYCNRQGTAHILSEIKQLSIPVVEIKNRS